MSLKGNPSKDTYIKLIVNTGPMDTIDGGVNLTPFKEIDITEQVLSEVPNIDEWTIRAYEWQNGNRGGCKPVADLKRLKDTINWEADRIFDACIVNEKQKKAVKELFNTRVWEAFDRDWRDLELAKGLLKSQTK